jgi:hypothetical protein
MKALDFALALLAAIAAAFLPAGSASTLELFTVGRGRYFGWMSGEDEAWHRKSGVGR